MAHGELSIRITKTNLPMFGTIESSGKFIIYMKMVVIKGYLMNNLGMDFAQVA